MADMNLRPENYEMKWLQHIEARGHKRCVKSFSDYKPQGQKRPRTSVSDIEKPRLTLVPFISELATHSPQTSHTNS
jgi:hypothetical protein